MIDRFNALSKWVVQKIVEETDLPSRTSLIQKFIAIAQKLRELNNYHDLMAVLAALSSGPVGRLKQTWQEVDKKQVSALHQLQELMHFKSSYKNYRSALRSTKPPAIPYIGMYLTDLTFIEEGGPNHIEHRVHFLKKAKVAEVIQEFMLYQKQPHAASIPRNTKIIAWIMSWNPLSEEEAQKLSLKLESRSFSDNDSFSSLLARSALKSQIIEDPNDTSDESDTLKIKSEITKSIQIEKHSSFERPVIPTDRNRRISSKSVLMLSQQRCSTSEKL